MTSRSKAKITLFQTSKPDSLGGRLLLAEQHYAHKKRLRKIHSVSSLDKNNHYFGSVRSYKSPEHNQASKIYKPNPYQIHINRQHERHVKHLVQVISRKKNFADRKKDPNDFFAYPVYFRRQNSKHSSNGKDYKNGSTFHSGKKLRKRTKQTKHINIQDEYGLKPYGKKGKLGKKRPVYTNLDHQSKNWKTFEQNTDSLEKPIGLPDQSPRLENTLTNQNIKNHLPYLQNFDRQDIEEFADSLTRLIFNYNINSLEKLSYLEKGVLSVLPKSYPAKFNKVVQQIFKQMAESLGLPDK